MWSFNQFQDSTIDEFYTIDDPGRANPKSTLINKIRFSDFGDKVFCNSAEGNLFMFRLDLDSRSHYPFIEMNRSRANKIKDFELLNRDTVVATTSAKQNHLTIYDLLLPPKKVCSFRSPVERRHLGRRRGNLSAAHHAQVARAYAQQQSRHGARV